MHNTSTVAYKCPIETKIIMTYCTCSFRTSNKQDAWIEYDVNLINIMFPNCHTFSQNITVNSIVVTNAAM